MSVYERSRAFYERLVACLNQDLLDFRDGDGLDSTSALVRAFMRDYERFREFKGVV